jgi:type IV pilus assembly protein PilW
VGENMPLPHENSTVWQYKHHVYFIEAQIFKEQNKTITVPALMRKRLTSDSGMITEVVMEGVESMRFIYGLDTTSDDQIDQYKIQENMSAADWDQSTTQILTVQVFLLARTLKPDNRVAKETRYIMGGTDNATLRTLTFNDRYRRTLLVSTIKLTNGSQATWRL